MRISGKIKQNKKPGRLIIIIVAGTVLTTFLFFIYYTFLNEAKTTSYFCDGEFVFNNNFISDGHKFLNGHTRSNEKALSGRYSSKVYKKNQYGLGYVFTGVNEGEIYEANVWKFSEQNVGAIVAQGDWDFWQAENTPIKKNAEGWELLTIKVIIPKNMHNKELKFYVWNTDASPAYFDDLRINKLSKKAEFSPNLSDLKDIKTLTIKMDDKGLNKLKTIRGNAYKVGILVTSNNDFVKIKLIDKDNSMPAFARLKGDWLDHLEGEKWSFRIKMKKNYAWNGMSIFSVQNPLTRHFLDEWVFHKLLEYEDILTPAYDFIRLHLNNNDLGIYAYEEHFTTQLLQRQQRKESVIVKFDEDGFWDTRVRNYQSQGSIASFEGAEILPFDVKKILKSEKLYEKFLHAQNLMYLYKNSKKTASEIFDLDRLAKYYALLDITKAFHGLIWHNQRMYFNPVTEKLEPIGFDGYAKQGVFDWIKRPFIGYAVQKDFSSWKSSNMLTNLFHDYLFVEKYISYLKIFSQKEYLHKFFSNIKSDLMKRELLLQTEFTDYKYNNSFLYKNAANIRNHLIPYEKLALKVYLQDSDKAKLTLRIGSTHALPIELIGIGSTTYIISYFGDRTIIPAYNRHNPVDFFNFVIRGNGNKIHYKILGLDSIYTVNINPWPAPISFLSAQELFNAIKTKKLESTKLYIVKNSEVIFYPGNYKVEKNIVIPENYNVKFFAGCNLDFTNHSKFISKSPVFMYGNEDKPILINSSDGTSGGFTILQADKKSYFNHVIFNNLNALDYKGWHLDGAVTFYESEVEMTDCKFSNIHAEDALNIIRSNFIISNTLFINCTGDALDTDFSKGQINNTLF